MNAQISKTMKLYLLQFTPPPRNVNLTPTNCKRRDSAIIYETYAFYTASKKIVDSNYLLYEVDNMLFLIGNN